MTRNLPLLHSPPPLRAHCFSAERRLGTRQKRNLYGWFTNAVDTINNEIKNVPSALLSYISTRDFSRTRRSARGRRAAEEMFLALLECSRKIPSA